MKRSVSRRIQIGALIAVAPFLLLTVGAFPWIWQLGGAIQAILRENYISIEAGREMRSALDRLQVALLKGEGPAAAASERPEFVRWLAIEESSITEVDEPQTVARITEHSARLFDQIENRDTDADYDAEFEQLRGDLAHLIIINEGAMFRDDQAANHLSDQLTEIFASGVVLAVGMTAILAWGLGWAMKGRLGELAILLREIAQRKKRVRIAPQPFAELDTVATEFNHMAEQLEYYELLDVQKLIYEKNKTEAIIESLEDGVILIDGEGKIALINEIACLILGIDERAVMGCAFDDLETQRPNFVRVRQALRQAGQSDAQPRRVELELFMRGRDHTYVLKLIPLQKGDDRLGALLILQDVTYLRDEDRVRTNLVATLAHELRTPLTSLGFATQMLRREGPQLAKSQMELVDTVFDDFTRLKRFADNLMELARGRIPAIAMHRSELDLGEIVCDVVKRFSLQAAEKQIHLDVTVGALPKVYGDAIKLPWVISNLIANALRYTGKGGAIEVSVQAEKDKTVRIEVADSGPGIEPELIDYIFERFAQYDGEQKGLPGAAGLGLAIAKDIVGAHQGRIFVQNRSPHGAIFVVEIPTGTPSGPLPATDRKGEIRENNPIAAFLEKF